MSVVVVFLKVVAVVNEIAESIVSSFGGGNGGAQPAPESKRKPKR